MTTSGRAAMSALQWQVARDTAAHYDQVLVPAYLGPAAQAVVERACPVPGEAVLDIGCGTGAAARAARRAVGPRARVVGVDVNRFMLDVARAGGIDAEFREGDARRLPFRDHSFDVALCANTLQFVPERVRAAAQMARVLRPGGRVSVGSWEVIDRIPYFAALAAAITRVMGAQVAVPLTSACTLGTPEELRGVLQEGGFTDVTVERVSLEVQLGRLETFVPRHLASTPMAAAFRAAGDEAVGEVVRDVLAGLRPAGTPAGSGSTGPGDVTTTFPLLVGVGRSSP